MKHILKYHQLGIFLAFIALLIAISPVVSQDSEQEDELLYGEAFVNIVSIVVDDMAEEAPVIAMVEGEVGDPCTQISSIEQTNDGDTILITITTERPMNLMCAAVVDAFEAEITIDITGLVAGMYSVSVNGTEATLDLPASLTAESAPESTPEAEATEELIECPEATEDSVLIDTDNYCFLYPTEYSAVANNFLALVNAPRNVDEGVRASILLEVRPTNALVLINAVSNLGDEYFDIFLELINLTNTEALVGEVEADNGEFIAFVLHEADIYIFTGKPNSDDLPETSAELDALWDTVLGSIVFK